MTDFKCFSSLKKITDFNYWGNGTKDMLVSLEGLKNCESLVLLKVQCAMSLTSIEKDILPKNLKKLILCNSGIETIAGIEGCSKIEYLNLVDNKIIDIAELAVVCNGMNGKIVIYGNPLTFNNKDKFLSSIKKIMKGNNLNLEEIEETIVYAEKMINVIEKQKNDPKLEQRDVDRKLEQLLEHINKKCLTN